MFGFMVITWVGLLLLMCFLVLSIAAGLYYLAELVEEFSETSARIIRMLNHFVLGIYVLLLILEDLPITLIVCGILSGLNNYLVLKRFPFLPGVTSFPLIAFALLLVVNHVITFRYFAQIHVHFIQVLSYFTICLWLMPFCFFVSLSANDNTLPTFVGNNETNDDLVTNYFTKNRRGLNLLSFLNSAKESFLPQRVKKSF